jgi:hypothetical protein
MSCWEHCWKATPTNPPACVSGNRPTSARQDMADFRHLPDMPTCPTQKRRSVPRARWLRASIERVSLYSYMSGMSGTPREWPFLCRADVGQMSGRPRHLRAAEPPPSSAGMLHKVQSNGANLAHGRLPKSPTTTATLAHRCRRGRPPHSISVRTKSPGCARRSRQPCPDNDVADLRCGTQHLFDDTACLVFFASAPACAASSTFHPSRPDARPPAKPEAPFSVRLRLGCQLRPHRRVLCEQLGRDVVDLRPGRVLPVVTKARAKSL